MTDEVTAPPTDDAATTDPPAARMRRALWTAGGVLALGIGFLGMVLPVLPTTVFFIIAAWCFGHSSPRLEQWVLDRPTFGPMVRDYRNGLGMPRRAKVFALTMMWAAIGFSAYVLRDSPGWVALVVGLGLVGSAYILFLTPTRERVLAARAATPTTP